MKTVKRIFVTLLVFSLLVCSVPFAVSAAGEGAISVGNASGYAGDVVALPVTLTALPEAGFVSGTFVVSYGENLEYVNTVQYGTNYGTLIFAKPSEAGAGNSFNLVYSNNLISNFEYTGQMCTLYFRIKSGATSGDAAAKNTVSVSADGIYNEDLDPVSFNFTSGVVTVADRSSALGESLYGHSLTLDGAIALNFHVSVGATLASDEDATVIYTINGTEVLTVEEKLSECRTDANGNLILSCRLPATMWSRTVSAQIVNGNGDKGDIYSYSVKNYALYMLSGNYTTGDSAEDEKLKELCVALLNYGGYAQNYFGYFNGSTEDLANGNVVSGDNKLISKLVKSSYDATIKTDDIASVNGAATGISYYGVNVSADAATAITHYFAVEGNVADYTFTLSYNDGAEKTSELEAFETDGKYAVIIPDIAAAYIDLPYTVTAKNNSDGTEFTVVYSVRSYMAHNIEGAPTAFANVIRAMYLYGEAANSYFGK